MVGRGDQGQQNPYFSLPSNVPWEEVPSESNLDPHDELVLVWANVA